MSYEALEAHDIISKGPVNGDELGSIVERLFTTHTSSSSGSAVKDAPKSSNSIARAPCTNDEKKEIFDRLAKTHTKSTNGEGCRPVVPTGTPGLGLAMLPVIEGIETRFMGEKLSPEKVQGIIEKMHATQTKSSQSRRDNPRVLLYPERTTLMNNVERIMAFQQTGSVAKQGVLQRREKWFN